MPVLQPMPLTPPPACTRGSRWCPEGGRRRPRGAGSSGGGWGRGTSRGPRPGGPSLSGAPRPPPALEKAGWWGLTVKPAIREICWNVLCILKQISAVGPPCVLGMKEGGRRTGEKVAGRHGPVAEERALHRRTAVHHRHRTRAVPWARTHWVWGTRIRGNSSEVEDAPKAGALEIASKMAFVFSNAKTAALWEGFLAGRGVEYVG